MERIKELLKEVKSLEEKIAYLEEVSGNIYYKYSYLNSMVLAFSNLSIQSEPAELYKKAEEFWEFYNDKKGKEHKAEIDKRNKEHTEKWGKWRIEDVFFSVEGYELMDKIAVKEGQHNVSDYLHWVIDKILKANGYVITKDNLM